METAARFERVEMLALVRVGFAAHFIGRRQASVARRALRRAVGGCDVVTKTTLVAEAATTRYTGPKIARTRRASLLGRGAGDAVCRGGALVGRVLGSRMQESTRATSIAASL